MILVPEDGTGLPNANSYASVADADAYHDARLHTLTWEAATTQVKERALAMATTTLDSMATWQGKRTTATQALAWPRCGALLDGNEVPDNVIPTPLKQATSELARLLIDSDVTQDVAQNDLAGLSLGKGALEIEFKSGAEKKRIPSNVDELLQGLGSLAAASSGGLRIRSVSR